MSVCRECGEPVAPAKGPGDPGMVFGYGLARDEEGNRVAGSEVEFGLFHPGCYKAWVAKYPLREDEPADPSQMIEDIGGGPPEGY